MSKRIALTLFAVLILALTACERSASTPLPTAQAQAGDFPNVPTASGNMEVVELAGTQTAIATAGTPTGGQAQPAEPVVTTPDPNATSTPNTSPDATSVTESTPLPAITTIPATAVKPATYALQKGEFPFCIARRFNLDPDELLALNGLSISQIYYSPGTVLRIPQTGKPFPGERALLKHPTSYTVLSEDTVYGIACKFGDVDPIAIATLNNLAAPYTLTIGMQINIP